MKGLFWWRWKDNGFHYRHWLRTSRNVVHNVKCCLWHGKHLLFRAKFPATMLTFISSIFRIAHSSTNHCLYIPIATQIPGVAIESTNGAQISLASHILVIAEER